VRLCRASEAGGDAQEQGEALRRPAQGLQARQVVSPDRFPSAPAPGVAGRVVGDSNARFASSVFIGGDDVRSKTSLRMAVARIKLLRNRKEAQVRQMRREVAQLLEANQDMTARIRVRASSHRFVISLHPRPLLRGDSTRLQRVIPRLTS